MKVGLLLPGFSAHADDWCTPSRLDHVRAIAEHAAVHVFTLRWPERGGRYRIGPVAVHAMNGRKRMGWRVARLWARTLGALAAEHRRDPFTVLHATCADEAALVAAWAGAWLDVPVVVSVTGGELMALRDIEYGLQCLRGRGHLARYVLRRAACVTVGSEYLRRKVEAFDERTRLARVVLAPFGVSLDRFTPAATTDSVAGPVLSVGSLTPVKNHRLALATVVRTKGRLTVAGDGPLRDDLAHRAIALGIADRVEWLGAVAHDRLPDIYRASTALVHTSRHEAQGMAILEAAASGLPVTGTAVGVLPELVPAGWPLPRPDAEGEAVDVLREQIVELLCCPVLRRQIGEHARSIVQERFSLRRTCQRFLDVYASPHTVIDLRSSPRPA